jgi:UDP-N-acetylglucosamine:LPS N-acetylglucosamine transferase
LHTILIPNSKSPKQDDRTVRQFKNIIRELKKQDFKVVWVNFSKNEIFDEEIDGINHVSFKKYKNAIELLEHYKPDVILNYTWYEFSVISVIFAARFKKIPTVTIFNIDPQYVNTKFNFEVFKKRLKKIYHKKNNKTSSESLNAGYNYFCKTILKTNMTILKKLKIIFSLPLMMLTKYLPSSFWISGEINLCYLKETKDKLQKVEFLEKTLIVVGNPDYDHIFSQFQNNNYVKKRTKYTSILICTSSMHESGYWSKKEEEKLLKKIIQELQKENYNVELKIHPIKSAKKEYIEFLNKNNFNLKIYQNEAISTLFEKFDLIITYGSTGIVLDAVFRKKPVILIRFSKKHPIPDYYDEKITDLCEKSTDLKNIINKSLSKEIKDFEYSSYFEKFLGPFDGKSSERITNEILKVIKKS